MIRRMVSSGSALAAALRARIEQGSARVGVVGLGYVGLPLALAFAESGMTVLGFDVDGEKIAALARGEPYIRHPAAGRLAPLVAAGTLVPTGDFGRLGEADAVLICVPTPLTPQHEPDLTYVAATGRQIAATLRPGQLVVLESTTYPGTTDELLRGLLEESGLLCGEGFFLAFSPERENPGHPEQTLTRLPKVVGGVDEASAGLAAALYSHVVPRVVRVSSARAAEATKLTENIFRAVNIALVNELKVIYDKLGVDIWEVLDAADTKPFGFMRFDPGPGWGGHCIPLDPFYLTWKAREVGQATGFIELAGQVNARMHDYVVEKLTLALNERGKPVKGSGILVMGIAYKRDLADPRESPAFDIIDRLLRLGARVSYHDPFIPRVPAMRAWPHLAHLESSPLDAESLAAADAVLIVTDHSCCDYELVLAHAPLVVDTRGVYRQPCGKVVRA
jgi:UDP-N-acetyl-D-glucosamine dehydrogenase